MADEKQKPTEHAEKKGEPKHAQAGFAGERKDEAAPERKEGDAKRESPLEANLAELSDKYLRISAEFDNYKKRTAREKEEMGKLAESKLMLRMLPIYEEIGFAEQGVAKIQDKHVRDGALLVLSKLRASFEKEGLARMKLEGEKFDPFRHEVAMSEPSDAPEGTIVRVIKQGYLYKGEILQHAIVSVSSGKKEGGTENKEAKE